MGRLDNPDMSFWYRSREPILTFQDNRRLQAAIVETLNGKRIEIDAGGEAVAYYDALALESLSWQEPETIVEMAKQYGYDANASEWASGTYDFVLDATDVELGNEYAYVTLTPVAGDRKLELASPKLGYSIKLGPSEIEAMAYLQEETISQFLETPFG